MIETNYWIKTNSALLKDDQLVCASVPQTSSFVFVWIFIQYSLLLLPVEFRFRNDYWLTSVFDYWMSVVIRRVLWCRPSGSLCSMDCVQAVQECMAQPECEKLYRQLDYCVDEEAVAPLGHEARQACADAQNALLHHQPLQECKCQRRSRKEGLCLRVYWTVRFPQGEEPVCVYVSQRVGVWMCMNASLGMCV